MGKRLRGDEDPVELNMVPIMNLFLAMIPFLISCAAFFQAAVINASVPALSEGGDPGQEEEEPAKVLDKITLKLQISSSGFTLSADGDQPEDELKAISGSIPMKDREYDFDKLAERCKALKDKYPKSDTVIVLPEKDVMYDTLVKTMDATRERIVDKYLDKREVLFTTAVVSAIL